MSGMLNWWNGLQASERRTLAIAAPVVALLLLYLLLIEPLWGYYQQHQRANQNLVASYQWLHQQAGTAATAPQVCQRVLPLNDEPRSALSASLRQQGLPQQQWQNLGEGWQLQLNSVDGQRFLRWLEQSVCQGLVVQKLELTRNSDNSVGVALQFVVL